MDSTPPPPPPLQPARPPSPSFYKRPLPEMCIPFASEQGKELFGQALREGHLDSYFKLASQFLTQNEPAYCGIGTLTMLLNSLEVDPQRKWKGPWRWFEQEMLDCCRPLTSVAEVGITLSEFACLARCNGLRASVTSPGAVPDLEKFRKDLKEASSGDTMMALSYSRKSLGQTGDGHFSPVGGYSEKDDMLLILDVARFKYPPYWLSVSEAWESMKPLDKQTGQPRGYALLSLLPTSDPSSLLAPPSLTSLSLNKSSWATLSNSLTKLLLSVTPSTTTSSLLSSLSTHISSRPTPILIPRSTPLSCASSLSSLVASLRTTKFFNLIHPIGASDPIPTIFLLAILSPKSALAKLIPPRLSEEVTGLVKEAMEVGGEELKKEIEVLGGQIEALGECCRAEQEGASCGCSGVKGG